MRMDRKRVAATMRTINYGRDRHTAPNPRHSRRSWSRLKPHTAIRLEIDSRIRKQKHGMQLRE